MNSVNRTFLLNRITSARNLGKSAATNYGNVAALALSRCGGGSENAFFFAQFRRFSAQATLAITVPGNQAYVIERHGKYRQTLNAGNHYLIPSADRITSVHLLDEMAIEVKAGSTYTKDFVFIVHVQGILNVKIVDPFLASYGCKSRDLASEVLDLAEKTVRSKISDVTVKEIIDQLPQTTEKSPIASIFHDRLCAVFHERNFFDKINKVTEEKWGIKCLRFKVRCLSVPVKMMEDIIWRAAEVEWRKRAVAIFSEAKSRSDGLVGMIEAEKRKGEEGKETGMIVDRAKEEGTCILAAVESHSKQIEEIYQGGPKWQC